MGLINIVKTERDRDLGLQPLDTGICDSVRLDEKLESHASHPGCTWASSGWY